MSKLNKRIYKIIMNRLNGARIEHGFSHWDYKSLRSEHPHIYSKLIEILEAEGATPQYLNLRIPNSIFR